MGFFTNGIPLWGEHRILVTEASFHYHRSKDGRPRSPTKVSSLVTMLLLSASFALLEKIMYRIVRSMKDHEPLLEDPEHCAVLSRNLVRALGTGTVSWLGFAHRRAYWPEMTERLGWMRPEGFERRLFAYVPGGHRCALLFGAYQLKNALDDLLVRSEGPINRLHHVVSVAQSWVCLHPGAGHFYVLASGATEVPAAVSSLYVNFDDGGMRSRVPGLGEAYPAARTTLSVLSGATFLAYRIVFWFYVFVEYVLDLRRAWRSPRTRRRWRPWIVLYVVNATILFGIQLVLLSTVTEYAARLARSLVF